jgi:hypothetical protein
MQPVRRLNARGKASQQPSCSGTRHWPWLGSSLEALDELTRKRGLSIPCTANAARMSEQTKPSTLARSCCSASPHHRLRSTRLRCPSPSSSAPPFRACHHRSCCASACGLRIFVRAGGAGAPADPLLALPVLIGQEATSVRVRTPAQATNGGGDERGRWG